jgi:DNA-binding MarR family transcriptional regulator
LTNQAKLGFSLFGFLLIGGLLTYWIRTLYLKRRYQYFTEAQWKFIQRLDKGGLQTEDLNEFLELGSSSWEVQRRKRSEYIKMINDLCLNQLGCELILRQRSKEDKRQVLYVMNVEAKNKLARLM